MRVLASALRDTSATHTTTPEAATANAKSTPTARRLLPASPTNASTRASEPAERTLNAASKTTYPHATAPPVSPATRSSSVEKSFQNRRDVPKIHVFLRLVDQTANAGTSTTKECVLVYPTSSEPLRVAAPNVSSVQNALQIRRASTRNVGILVLIRAV